jgi:hypothetical protein
MGAGGTQRDSRQSQLARSGIEEHLQFGELAVLPSASNNSHGEATLERQRRDLYYFFIFGTPKLSRIFICNPQSLRRGGDGSASGNGPA